MFQTDEERAVSALEVRAALALGELSGALRHCDTMTVEIFIGKILRHSLMSALRQEGHSFTDPRFHAWFAGLATLSDDSSHHARPPRAICNAILAELAASSWPPLALQADRLRSALLAPVDLQNDAANAQAYEIVEEARALLHTDDRQDAPLFAALKEFHDRIGQNPEFAPVERSESRLALQDRIVSVPRLTPASPIWAADIVAGRFLNLRPPIPLPGLVRPSALTEPDALASRVTRAQAFHDAVAAMNERLRDAAGLAAIIAEASRKWRGTSRAPQVFAAITGFGPLRSSQLETMLEASRLGIRGMIASLDEAGLVGRLTISGSHLYDVRLPETSSTNDLKEAPSAFSETALSEYEESLRALDRLLGDAPNNAPDGF